MDTTHPNPLGLDFSSNFDETGLLLSEESDGCSTCKRRGQPTFARRRQVQCLLLALLLVFATSSTLLYKRWPLSKNTISELQTINEFDRLSAVNGPPTAKFRDNLKPDLSYISVMMDSGWTNQVIAYMNLLYLAAISQRIPILGYFTPTHVGPKAGVLDFGTVFDVPRLSKRLNFSVLEWHEVKDRNSTEVDQLGCWDVWRTVKPGAKNVRGNGLALELKFDISYTKTPESLKMFEKSPYVSFFSLASLAYPEWRQASLLNPVVYESPINSVRFPPDDHVVCFDQTYYVCAYLVGDIPSQWISFTSLTQPPDDYLSDYAPAWRFVGQHMRWMPELERLAAKYVQRALGLEDSGKPYPPYISIHIRHGDFRVHCGNRPLDQCYASLDVIGRRVKEIQEELWQRKGLHVQYVVMTSDERNATWWHDVKKRGWYILDHSQTVETYGHWYPVLIDAVVQSNGVGFIGTYESTMSSMARRRVQSWHDGAVRLVKFGNAHSDDH